jgi:hypothetical protein
MPDIRQKLRIVTSGTYVHANGTTEDDAIIITNNDKNVEVAMDMTAITQNTTVRTYEKIDGTTYIKTSEAIYPTDFDSDSVIIILNGKTADQKITFQSGTGEGAGRNVDWRRIDGIRND